MSTQNIFDLTDTWNNVATTFTAVKMNVTDTASAAGSLLIDLQTNGTSQFSVTKAGNASSQQLTVTGAAGVSAGTFGICRSVDNDRLIIAGGDTTSSTTGGARVVLNGDAHPSAPNVSFYDAATHTFRDVSGGATGVFSITGRQTLTGPSLTGTEATSVVDIAQTWNTTGTPTLLKANITDTASAAGSLLMDLQVGGSSRFNVRKDGSVFYLGSMFGATGSFFYPSGTSRGTITSPINGVFLLSNAAGTTSSYLAADEAANTLALRNGTNAQAFRLYNTYTDASNYERGFIRYSSNRLDIGHEAAGTGTQNRVIRILSGNGTQLFFGDNNGIQLGAPINLANNTGPDGIRRFVAAVTSDGTEQSAGRLITNRGATGTVTRTLQTFTDNQIFVRIASQALRVKPSTGAAFLRLNGTLETADKYLELGSNGATLEVVYDGTNYVCIRESGTITVQP